MSKLNHLTDTGLQIKRIILYGAEFFLKNEFSIQHNSMISYSVGVTTFITFIKYKLSYLILNACWLSEVYGQQVG